MIDSVLVIPCWYKSGGRIYHSLSRSALSGLGKLCASSVFSASPRLKCTPTSFTARRSGGAELKTHKLSEVWKTRLSSGYIDVRRKTVDHLFFKMLSLIAFRGSQRTTAQTLQLRLRIKGFFQLVPPPDTQGTP